MCEKQTHLTTLNVNRFVRIILLTNYFVRFKAVKYQAPKYRLYFKERTLHKACWGYYNNDDHKEASVLVVFWCHASLTPFNNIALHCSWSYTLQPFAARIPNPCARNMTGNGIYLLLVSFMQCHGRQKVFIKVFEPAALYNNGFMLHISISPLHNWRSHYHRIR